MNQKKMTRLDNPVAKYLKQMHDAKTHFNGRESLSDYFYPTIENLLLREGRLFRTHFTNKEEKIVKELFKDLADNGRHTQQKQCYYNSQMALLTYSGVHRSDLSYVEGYGYDPKIGLPIQHGFLAYKGKIIDLTWGKSDYGIAERQNIVYYGIEISQKDLMKSISDTNAVQSHLDAYWAKYKILQNKFVNNKPYLNHE